MKRSFEANQTHSVLTLDDMHLFNSYAMEKELYKMNNFTNKDIKNAKSFIEASSDSKPSFDGVPNPAIIAWANTLVAAFNKAEQESEFSLAESAFKKAGAIAETYISDNEDLLWGIVESGKIPASGVLATTLAEFGKVSVVRTITDRYLQSLPAEDKPVDPLEAAEVESMKKVHERYAANIGMKGFTLVHRLYCTAKGKGKTMARNVFGSVFGDDIQLKKRKGKGKVKIETVPRYSVDITVGAPIE